MQPFSGHVALFPVELCQPGSSAPRRSGPPAPAAPQSTGRRGVAKHRRGSRIRQRSLVDGLVSYGHTTALTELRQGNSRNQIFSSVAPGCTRAAARTPAARSRPVPARPPDGTARSQPRPELASRESSLPYQAGPTWDGAAGEGEKMGSLVAVRLAHLPLVFLSRPAHVRRVAPDRIRHHVAVSFRRLRAAPRTVLRLRQEAHAGHGDEDVADNAMVDHRQAPAHREAAAMAR